MAFNMSRSQQPAQSAVSSQQPAASTVSSQEPARSCPREGAVADGGTTVVYCVCVQAVKENSDNQRDVCHP
jgi:hypothetical protein